MKKILIIKVIFILVATFMFLPQALAIRHYSFASASTGGTWYILGAGFASHINKLYPKVKLTAEVTGGSVENYYLLKRKKIDFCLNDVENVLDDITKEAYGGMAKEKVRILIGAYHTSDYHWIVRKGSGIKRLCDIKGKKVSIGPHGQMSNYYSLKVFKSACGYEPGKDFKAFNYSFNESKTGIMDDVINVGMAMAGFPVAAVIDLASMVDIDLISLTDEEIDRVLKVWPVAVKVIIPAGTYKGIDYDVTTLGNASIILCKPEIPDEDVYEITKAMFTNQKERNGIHPQAKKYTIEATVDIGSRLAKMGVSLHSGVIKYLKEIGAWKPELEVKE